MNYWWQDDFDVWVKGLGRVTRQENMEKAECFDLHVGGGTLVCERVHNAYGKNKSS